MLEQSDPDLLREITVYQKMVDVFRSTTTKWTDSRAPPSLSGRSMSHVRNYLLFSGEPDKKFFFTETIILFLLKRGLCHGKNNLDIHKFKMAKGLDKNYRIAYVPAALKTSQIHLKTTTSLPG
jgi:hypothetical protein